MNKLFRASLLILLAVLLASCSSDKQLPVGATVVVEPAVREIHIAGVRDENNLCVWFEGQYLDVPVAIRVLSNDDSPVGEADLSVWVDWAGNTFSGVEALKLYDDRDGDLVVDDPVEKVSGDGDAIFRTEVDKYTGEVVLMLRINLSCGYRGSVTAVSNGVVGQMDINIVDDNEDP